MAEEKILDRVAKLLAKANRTDNEVEADAYFAKATELMTKHAIEQWELVGRGEAPRPNVITRSVSIREKQDKARTRAVLIHQIAKANRCETVRMVGMDMVTIYGFESDVEFVKTLYGLVLVQMEYQTALAWRVYLEETHYEARDRQSRYLFVKGFQLGFGMRVGERLDEARIREEQNHAGAALALVDRSALVLAAMPETRSSSVRLSTSVGIAEGEAAGSRADLSGGRNNVGGFTRSQIAGTV